MLKVVPFNPGRSRYGPDVVTWDEVQRAMGRRNRDHHQREANRSWAVYQKLLAIIEAEKPDGRSA
jgi:hypothetical protein